MSYYSREEQETLYNYDPINGTWRAYSTYPPDIKTLLSKADVIRTETDEAGRVVMVDGYLTRSQVRIYG
ncbi:hypothetical protein KIS4809_4645 [Bacillus sp. ZZV12-4809]|nr:hypothetical protein KIS4809_4645 [Bacillus sp. ZZV12-4809]